MARDSHPPRILILGSTGQVGHELSARLPQVGPVTSLSRNEADLADPESLRSVVRASRPDVIVNAAAFTAVDRAESEPDLALTVNAVAPGVLAEEAHTLGSCIIQYSTDYVFDGKKDGPYVEDDPPNPLSTYGRTKLAGEQAVAQGCARHLIFRTSWVVGAHGHNFLKTMLRLAAERDELRIVADQLGVPTSAALIAEVTAKTIQDMVSADGRDPRWGIYHLAPSGETTWHQYTCYLIDQARNRGWPIRVKDGGVHAISTDEYPTPAARPLNSRLDTTRLRATFELLLPEWQRGVDDVLAQLHPDRPR